MALMTQREYARKRKLPYHLVREAGFLLENPFYCDDFVLDKATETILLRKIDKTEMALEKQKGWLENVRSKIETHE